MSESNLLGSFGDSWAAKIIGTVVMIAMGAFGGWWTSRANIMNAVNEQVKTLMAHYVSEISRLTDAHHACEERLDAQNERIEQLEGQVRQEKQIMASMKKVGEQ